MKSCFILASCLAASFLLVACGGDPKGAKAPESNAEITETSAKEDMPPPPAKTGDAPPPSTGPTPADTKLGPVPAGGMLKLAAMKVTPAKKGKSDKVIELKDDGTILVDGKPAAKIKGDQVDSTAGTSMVTIGVDGSLVGNGVKAGYRFEGDEIISDSGEKLMVADDGAISWTKDGKAEMIGKAEGGGAAKRTALIVAVLWLNVTPAGGGKSGPPKKPGGKK